MSAEIAIVCEVCGRLIGYGRTMRAARAMGLKRHGNEAVTLRGRDMCGRCWATCKEFPKRERRRATQIAEQGR